MTWVKAVESDMSVKGLMQRMQRIGQNGGLCHGEQKANSYNSRKNRLKTFVVVVVCLLQFGTHILQQTLNVSAHDHSMPFVFVADDAFPLRTNIMKPFGRTDLEVCVQLQAE